MSNETSTAQTTLLKSNHNWETPIPPSALIFDDGEPLESPRHRIAMNLLIRLAQQARRDRPLKPLQKRL